MPISLETRLNPIKEDVLKAVSETSIEETMTMYGVKTRRTFVKWLEAHGNGALPVNPLAELKGGEKHKFLREHRQTILDLEETFGRDFVKGHFCIKEETLDAILRFEPSTFISKFTKSDRALAKAEIAEQAVKELRQEIKELRQQFATFQESVGTQLAKKFLIPLLQSAIKIDESLIEKPKPEPDLSITGLITQAKSGD